MLYQDATDKALDEDIYLDLNEAERAGSTENVQIVSQIKRYRGKGQAPDAWPSTRRFHVTAIRSCAPCAHSRWLIWAR